MTMMKVGTRLTLALLAALTPVLLGYMYWTVQRSSLVYLNEFKRDIRATTHSLAPALENDIWQDEWDEVDDILRRMNDDGTAVALLKPDGGILRASSQEVSALVLRMVASNRVREGEFEARDGGSDWFWRVAPLKDRAGKDLALLVVGQDWTDVREDLEERTAVSGVAALAVAVIVIALIPLLVGRYVSRPLAELSRKVTRFSDDAPRERQPATDEVSLLTQEFRKLDDQLNVARRDLLAKHRRELELERSLQHAERLATVGTLASGLAHEIGTPMGIIRGRAEQLLRGNSDNERSRKGLEIIVTQIDRVSRIVRMLLDYGRHRESRRTRCDLRQILSHAMSLMETEASRRRVTVTARLGDRPLLADCDAGQLQQVFVNLEMNALDAMTPRGGTLHIIAEAVTSPDGENLQFSFADTGPGVSPKDAGRVFDPFFTTKEPGSGTGMGLAVSQSIVRDHAGEISFESGPEGTKFLFIIPAAQQAEPKQMVATRENHP